MVLDKLGSSLKDTLSKIAKSIFVDDKLINELVKDIQRALLQSDVNVKLVFELTNKIKERITKEQTPAVLTKKEHLVNIVYEELTNFLGKDVSEIKVVKSGKDGKEPFKIMLVGLFGSGKTTTTGKIAKYFTKRGYKVALVGLDVHRPAAIDQIMQVGKAINVPVYSDKEIALGAQKTGDINTAALRIYEKFEKLHEYEKYDILIVDTAGRDALSEDLVEELKLLNGKIKPSENLLVLSADIGQAAQKQAQSFHDACGVTGVIITKLDGTAKGGGALSACSITNANVKFIGVGEKVDDLEYFSPKRFVGRLLGMGDIESLLEKAKDAMDEISEEKAKDMGEKFMSGKFNLVDLYQQMEAMSKMGPLGKVMELIPGMGQLKLPKDMISVQEGKLKKWKYIMNSCTKKELEDPELISGSRIERIAKGSGCSINEIRELLKQYKQSKKMVKMMGGGSPRDMERMMKKLQGGGMPQMKFR
ncbi:TPA: signal recognition particle protein [Candidatus Woesearchaeota archaeon]|nr:signal recognition particle protein [Candidatus Woesearchaeota archaeon]